MSRHAIPTEVSFWRRVKKEATESGCWLWQGARQKTGHGIIGLSQLDGGGTLLVARYSYQLAYGSIAEGLVITQVCENKLCVRPDHLAAVTRKQATAGNGKSGPPKDRCPRGHRYVQAGGYKRNETPKCILCQGVTHTPLAFRIMAKAELP